MGEAILRTQWILIQSSFHTHAELCNIYNLNPGRKCALFDTTPINPHGLNLQASSGWSAWGDTGSFPLSPLSLIQGRRANLQISIQQLKCPLQPCSFFHGFNLFLDLLSLVSRYRTKICTNTQSYIKSYTSVFQVLEAGMYKSVNNFHPGKG